MNSTPTKRLVVDSLEAYPPIEEIDPQDHELYRREVNRHNKLLAIFADPEVVVCHDFWGNIGGVRSAKKFLSAREPTIDCMAILGLQGTMDVDEFVTICQTVPHITTRDYLENLGKRFNLSVTDEMHRRFFALVQSEHNRVYIFTDVVKKLRRIAKRHRQGLVTNTPWTSTLIKFLSDEDLFGLFAEKIVSSIEGLAKQHGTQIYKLTALRFNSKPSKIVMIGNDLPLDILPALEIGMMVILNDREGKYVDDDGDWLYFEKADGYADMSVRWTDEHGKTHECKIADLTLEALKERTYGDLVVKHLDAEGHKKESRLEALGIPVTQSYDPIPALPE